jgi:hypothetical protein
MNNLPYRRAYELKRQPPRYGSFFEKAIEDIETSPNRYVRGENLYCTDLQKKWGWPRDGQYPV